MCLNSSTTVPFLWSHASIMPSIPISRLPATTSRELGSRSVSRLVCIGILNSSRQMTSIEISIYAYMTYNAIFNVGFLRYVLIKKLTIDLHLYKYTCTWYGSSKRTYQVLNRFSNRNNELTLYCCILEFIATDFT